MDRLRRRLHRARAALLAPLLLIGAGCGTGSATSPELGVGAYQAVIDRFAPTPSADDEPLRIIYVTMIGDAELSLDDQVAIIDGFAATHEVRFVDEIEAAIDGDQPGSPPKDSATLLALGRITPEPPHTVRVESYVDADRTDASLVTVVAQAGRWSVRAVEPVDPEVVVDDE